MRSDLNEAERLRAAIGDFVRYARRHDTMPVGQATVLGQLEREGDLSIAGLARRADVKHQSMTRTVNLLFEQGLVVIGADVKDQRRVRVTLTDDGRAALNTQRRHRASWIARATQSLPARDREALRRVPALLNALAAADTKQVNDRTRLLS